MLAKRQVLIHLGLPEPALRIAVVLTPSFVRHAVLTVVTDEGNFVLDNLHDESSRGIRRNMFSSNARTPQVFRAGCPCARP